MSPELQSSFKDIPFTTSDRLLTAEDQEWLSSYGVDPSWQDDQRLAEELTLLIATGSRRLDEPENQTIEAHTQIMTAREKFFRFVGVSDETLSFFMVESNHPTIIPLDTFIGTQRMFAQYDLNASKVINKFPSALGYAPETVKEKLDNLTTLGLNATKVINTKSSALGYAPETIKEKLDNLTTLGLDATKVINANPNVLGLAPETIKEKIDNLTTLGLDAAKVINTNPSVINLAPETIKEKIDNLTTLGLDATKIINKFPQTIGLAPETIKEKIDNLTTLGLNTTKVINTHPGALGLAPETVKEKLDNLTALGLDAAKVINTSPSAIGLAPESVKAKIDNLSTLGLDATKVINKFSGTLSLAPETVKNKMKFLSRSTKLLQWEHSAQELVETFPSILGINIQKLRILRRIASHHINEASRSADPGVISNALYVPLEKYIIILSEQAKEDSKPFEIKSFINSAYRLELDATQRKQKALSVAPHLGRIGVMYANYQNK